MSDDPFKIKFERVIKGFEAANNAELVEAIFDQAGSRDLSDPDTAAQVADEASQERITRARIALEGFSKLTPDKQVAVLIGPVEEGLKEWGDDTSLDGIQLRDLED